MFICHFCTNTHTNLCFAHTTWNNQRRTKYKDRIQNKNVCRLETSIALLCVISIGHLPCTCCTNSLRLVDFSSGFDAGKRVNSFFSRTGIFSRQLSGERVHPPWFTPLRSDSLPAAHYKNNNYPQITDKKDFAHFLDQIWVRFVWSGHLSTVLLYSFK